jgi:predicted Zn-dependent protease
MIPLRADTYPFTGPLGDIFHWPSDRLPVRYWADPRGALRQYVSQAIQTWQEQLLYGEFAGEMVNDSTQADVIVLWTDSVPPDVPPDQGAPVKSCGGATSANTDTSGVRLDGPMHTQLTILTGTVFTSGQVAACLERTTLHEIGHTLGLLAHSSDTLDIMYFTPMVRAPSPSDRWTVQVLYHTTPNVFPAPR